MTSSLCGGGRACGGAAVDGAVAAGLLGLFDGALGEVEHEGAAIFEIVGDADTARDADRDAAGGERNARDGLAEALGGAQCLFGGAVGEEHAQGVGAVAADDVFGAAVALDRAR